MRTVDAAAAAAVADDDFAIICVDDCAGQQRARCCHCRWKTGVRMRSMNIFSRAIATHTLTGLTTFSSQPFITSSSPWNDIISNIFSVLWLFLPRLFRHVRPFSWQHLTLWLCGERLLNYVNHSCVHVIIIAEKEQGTERLFHSRFVGQISGRFFLLLFLVFHLLQFLSMTVRIRSWNA